MISGARGAVSWAMLSMELDAIERELNALKEENAFLENKINCLRENNLDLDLLEEQARNILGFANENDTIVLLPREIK
jgi:cell division protein FtsB